MKIKKQEAATVNTVASVTRAMICHVEKNVAQSPARYKLLMAMMAVLNTTDTYRRGARP